MDQFTYENQGSDKFLIYRLREGDELDRMALGMLSHNHIPHLLQVSYVQIDEERYLRYSGLSQSTLQSQLAGVISGERLLGIFCSICEGIQLSGEYLLDGNSFVLNQEAVFVDRTGERTSLIYLPVLGEKESTDYISFFKNIIMNVITDPADDGNYITGILNYLNGTDNFSLMEFSALLKKLRAGRVQASGAGRIRNQAEVKPQDSKEKPARKPVPVKKQIQEPVPKPEKSGQAQESEKKTEGDRPLQKPKLGMEKNGFARERSAPQKQLNQKKQQKPSASIKKDGGEYSFEVPGGSSVRPSVPAAEEKKEEDSRESMSMMHLIRNFSGENLKKYKELKQEQKTEGKKSGASKEKLADQKKTGRRKGPVLRLVSLDPGLPYIFDVKNDSFCIGRKENNDGVLETISSVSRAHCRILREAGAFYVEDLNSKFGTKVDGVACVPGRKSVLEDQSVLELPGISFRAELREK